MLQCEGSAYSVVYCHLRSKHASCCLLYSFSTDYTQWMLSIFCYLTNSWAFSEALGPFLRGRCSAFPVQLLESSEQVETRLLKYSAKQMEETFTCQILFGKSLPEYVA